MCIPTVGVIPAELLVTCMFFCCAFKSQEHAMGLWRLRYKITLPKMGTDSMMLSLLAGSMSSVR